MKNAKALLVELNRLVPPGDDQHRHSITWDGEREQICVGVWIRFASFPVWLEDSDLRLSPKELAAAIVRVLQDIIKNEIQKRS